MWWAAQADGLAPDPFVPLAVWGDGEEFVEEIAGLVVGPPGLDVGACEVLHGCELFGVEGSGVFVLVDGAVDAAYFFVEESEVVAGLDGGWREALGVLELPGGLVVAVGLQEDEAQVVVGGRVVEVAFEGAAEVALGGFAVVSVDCGEALVVEGLGLGRFAQCAAGDGLVARAGVSGCASGGDCAGCDEEHEADGFRGWVQVRHCPSGQVFGLARRKWLAVGWP